MRRKLGASSDATGQLTMNLQREISYPEILLPGVCCVYSALDQNDRLGEKIAAGSGQYLSQGLKEGCLNSTGSTDAMRKYSSCWLNFITA